MYLKRDIVCVSILAFLLIAGSSALADEKQKNSPIERGPIITKIYFVPFKAQTDVLITPENIERTNAYTIWFVRDGFRRDHPFTKTLRQLIERTTGKIEIKNHVIRLKVEFVQDQVAYLVDQEGTVERHDGKRFHLEQNEMDEIEGNIKSFSGVVDRHAVERLHVKEMRK